MIQEAFKKFADYLEIDLNIHNYLEKTKLEFDKTENGIENYQIVFFTTPKLKEFLFLQKKINIYFKKNQYDFSFKIAHQVFEEDVLFEYLNYFASLYFQKKYNSVNKEYFKIYKTFNNFSLDIEGNFNIFTYDDPDSNKDLFSILKIVNLNLLSIGLDKLKLNLKTEKKFEIDDTIQTVEIPKKANKTLGNSKINNSSYNKNKIYVKQSIQECYTSEEENVEIEGFIVNFDKVITKNNSCIITMIICDYTEAIKSRKFFVNVTNADKFFGEIQQNDWVKINGKIDKDNYNDSFINISKIEKIENQKNLFKDDASVKRIELSIKTSMNTMDGFKSAKDFVDFAIENKYNSIAINDLNSIQSFPIFYNEAKKHKNFKPIYGASFNVLEKNNKAIRNLDNSKTFKDETYVIFDLETTGLSPIKDDIIEFGAQKIQNNKVIEQVQFFIKPNKPIPPKITDLTKIKNEDVENAISQEQGIIKIKEFIENHSIVAHNATFDSSFLIQKYEDYGLGVLKNQIIDTLIIDRIIYPNDRKFNLENCATRAGILYDSSIAHRADYDTAILTEVFMSQLNKLIEMDIKTFLDLYNYSSKKLYSKIKPKEITILAKNKEGLKELFKLISFASTDNFLSTPTLFLEELPKSKNLFIGSGSSTNSIIINELLLGTKERVRNLINYFDYIEIIPPKNFRHEYERNNFQKEDIHNILSFLINESIRQNKIPVAVGEVRYLDKKEKILHEIYINAKGLQNQRHHLFDYRDKNPKYPEFIFLSTKDMLKQFEFLNDQDLASKIVIDNSNFIANQIEKDIVVIKEKLYTPTIPDSGKMLTELVYKTAHEKYGDPLPEIIETRIKRELEPILKYGFDVIYWISHKLVRKSLDDGYLVGSRGSVGSSLVAYLSGITEVNPLIPHYICENCKYTKFIDDSSYTSGFDLEFQNCPKCNNKLKGQGQTIPFETFLGFEADKVPDIDLNFSGDYQSIIHNEVKNIFGENYCFRAGTISTTAEKTAFGFVISWLEENQKNCSNAFRSFLAQNLIGTKRTTGQHPGGIIVIPNDYDVEDFTPINFPANDDLSDWKTTHFDFRAIHDNVLKLDLLGHDDPTAIKSLTTLTKVDVNDIPFKDEKVIQLFSSTQPLGIRPEDISGETTGALGIPEFGTSFVRKMLKNVKVKTFADLISISGLSHGTDVWTNNAENIIKNFNKSLKEVVSCRDDIMVYLMSKNVEGIKAFQIMEKVRKGKGLNEEDEKLLLDHKIESWYIDSLKKIKYMFPKAHATAYVMMAWRVAWFKVYYPLEYYAVYLTTRADIFDLDVVLEGRNSINKKLKYLNENLNNRTDAKLSNKEVNLIPILQICEELMARNIKIKGIDLRISKAKEWVIDKKDNSLIPPFMSIDGLGEAVALKIIEERKQKEFISIENFVKRCSINKTILDKMKNLKILEYLDDTNQIPLF